MRTESWLVAGVAALAAVTWGRGAAAYCRTSTCPIQADYSPSNGMCTPPDFAELCETMAKNPVRPVPLWWRNACVGYDVQQDASAQVPYKTAAAIAAQAFSRWTETQCDAFGAPGQVSIDVRDLGPVRCDLVQYSSDQGNQHVIVFRDNGWPHESDTNNTLGLTTVTFDPNTGEIFDADMEINSSVPLAFTDPIPSEGYDLQSIITHEAGHFLGLAHAYDPNTTMWASYLPGTTTKRILTADDMAGICAIYPPGGLRSVDPSVQASGVIPEEACDPTPRHGFQSQCAQPKSATCSLASSGTRASSLPLFGIAAGILGGAGAVRRRRRRDRSGAAARPR